MSRFFKFAIAGPTGAAVPFQFIANDGNLVVNPIPLTEPRRAGHCRALRHRRRLLQVPRRRQAAPRQHLEADERQQARRRGDAGASPAGRCRRPGARRHAAVPGRRLRAERRRARRHPDHGQQLREQRQERGAAKLDRSDPDRDAGRTRVVRVRPQRRTAIRAIRSRASARPIAPRWCSTSPGPSASTARPRTR